MIRTIIKLMLLFVLLFPSTAVFAAVDPASVSTFAGNGEWGSKDGEKHEASFRLPTYAAVDRDGTIYVADTTNHLIRKLDTNGKVTTIAGVIKERAENGEPIGGMKDGSALEAMFNEPRGIAVATSGQIYVADSQNGAIRIIEPSGEVITLIEDLDFPTDLAFDKSGNLFVSETLKHRIVKVSKDGQLTVVAGGGYTKKDDFLVGGLKDGAGEIAQFNEPTGLALAANGTLYIADTGNQRIRALSPQGNVTTIAGSGMEKIAETGYVIGGFQDGAATDAQFNYPQGLALSADGTIYVADTLNHRIRKITTNGQVYTVAGVEDYGNENGIEARASFDRPMDIIALSDSNLIIVDQWNHSLRLLQWDELPQGVKKSESIQVIFEDKVLSFDIQPEIVSGRVMIPIRTLAEAFGYKVTWNEEAQTVTFIEGEQKVSLQIGSKVVVGEQNMTIDAAPYTKENRTFVPIRFVAEAFNKHVNWLESSNAVLIRK